MEIRPINRQSSWFKETSAGLAIKVFCSPLSSSLATFLSGKTRADKRMLLVGLERDESLSFVFKVSNTYDLKVFVMAVVPWGAKAFPLSFSKFFLVPSFSVFHSCCQAAHSCSDTETLAALAFCSAPIYHVFIPLKSQALQDAFHSTSVFWWGFSSLVSCLDIHCIYWPSHLECWQNVCPDFCWGMCICIWGWWIIHLYMHRVWCASEAECLAECKWRRTPLKSSIIWLSEFKR